MIKREDCEAIDHKDGTIEWRSLSSYPSPLGSIEVGIIGNSEDRFDESAVAQICEIYNFCLARHDMILRIIQASLKSSALIEKKWKRLERDALLKETHSWRISVLLYRSGIGRFNLTFAVPWRPWFPYAMRFDSGRPVDIEGVGLDLIGDQVLLKKM